MKMILPSMFITDFCEYTKGLGWKLLFVQYGNRCGIPKPIPFLPTLGIRKTDSLTSPCKSYKEYCHLLLRYTSQGNSTGNKMICCNPGPEFTWSSWCSVQSWAELGMFKIPMLEWEMVWRNYQFPKHNLVSVKTTWTSDLQTLACLVRVS